jgi:hypothetical protein
MTGGGRYTLSKKNREIVELLHEVERRRRRELSEDKVYRYVSQHLKTSIIEFRRTQKALVLDFFKKFGFFTPAKLRASQQFIGSVKDVGLRRFFHDYLNFAARFGVAWKIPRSGRLRVDILPPWGTRFAGRIKNGNLLPLVPFTKDDAAIHLFEAPDLKAAPHLEKEIQNGRASYVEIVDNEGSSVLTQLEAFAYHQGCITFVVHKVEKPYMMCFVGENVSAHAWHEAGKVIKELRKKHFGRVGAGQPPDLTKFDRMMKARRTGRAMKEEILKLSGDEARQFETNKVFASRAAKRANSLIPTE